VCTGESFVYFLLPVDDEDLIGTTYIDFVLLVFEYFTDTPNLLVALVERYNQNGEVDLGINPLIVQQNKLLHCSCR
jgi:hypothetical protein